MSFVRVELIGHLGDAPQVRYTRTGTALAYLSVATEERVAGDAGRGRRSARRPVWHRVEVWGPLVATLQGHASKGERVFVSGTLDYRHWTSLDGTRHRTTVVKVAGPRTFLRLLGACAPPPGWPDGDPAEALPPLGDP